MSQIATDYIQIEYLADANAVFSNWLTSPSSQEFREGMLGIIEAMRQHKTGKIVSDTRNIGAIDLADQEWSLTDWTVKALEAGYKGIAIVISSDIFAQMSVTDIMDKADGGLFYKYFDSVEEARQWVAAQ
ncbi:MAG: hypothetical protein MUD08_11500 [Cytophagales bacterium]|nr:hypothetical protein [Cytophagales bacterium]